MWPAGQRVLLTARLSAQCQGQLSHLAFYRPQRDKAAGGGWRCMCSCVCVRVCMHVYRPACVLGTPSPTFLSIPPNFSCSDRGAGGSSSACNLCLFPGLTSDKSECPSLLPF